MQSPACSTTRRNRRALQAAPHKRDAGLACAVRSSRVLARRTSRPGVLRPWVAVVRYACCNKCESLMICCSPRAVVGEELLGRMVSKVCPESLPTCGLPLRSRFLHYTLLMLWFTAQPVYASFCPHTRQSSRHPLIPSWTGNPASRAANSSYAEVSTARVRQHVSVRFLIILCLRASEFPRISINPRKYVRGTASVISAFSS